MTLSWGVYVMGYTVDDLAYILGRLIEHGADFVVVGDTVVQLALKKKEFEGDVDIFALEPSPLVEEEFYRSIAEEEGWDMGTTGIGTPKFVAKVGDKDIVIEVYESFMDVEIPLEILNEARSIKLGGYKIKVLRPEQYFVLKARQGVDLDKLAKYYKELKKLDKKILAKTLEYFPDDEKEIIKERLRDIGVEL